MRESDRAICADEIATRRAATRRKCDIAIALALTCAAAIASGMAACGGGRVARSNVPFGYKGTMYFNPNGENRPPGIPGRIQATQYDLGGEGVAYHDTDAINHGSGELNHKLEHCEDRVPVAICRFRENDGMDISYVKKGADLNHPNMVTPDWQQLYIGWTEDGEWVNYTTLVDRPGTYRISTLYTHVAQAVEFSLNGSFAAECKLPVDPSTQIDMTKLPDWAVWHVWNKADCGTIQIPNAGLNLLTLHLKHGNNFAYFDFVEEPKR
jgi:hypothetical protein